MKDIFACGEWESLYRSYAGEGEASPMGRHARACAACRARARREAPEVLFALLKEPPEEFFERADVRQSLASLRMPWETAAERRTGNAWAGGLRKAASLLIVLGLGWGGFVLSRQSSLLLPEPLPLSASATASAPGGAEDLRARYPVVKEVLSPTPYYATTLADGTPMVYFHVPEF
jgi:hypothetical protein